MKEYELIFGRTLKIETKKPCSLVIGDITVHIRAQKATIFIDTRAPASEPPQKKTGREVLDPKSQIPDVITRAFENNDKGGPANGEPCPKQP